MSNPKPSGGSGMGGGTMQGSDVMYANKKVAVSRVRFCPLVFYDLHEFFYRLFSPDFFKIAAIRQIQHFESADGYSCTICAFRPVPSSRHDIWAAADG